MSEENVEIVERAIAALNERDIDDYLACCTPAWSPRRRRRTKLGRPQGRSTGGVASG